MNLYKITESLTTMGFSNPTFVMAYSREEDVSKLENRVQTFFPTYKVKVRCIKLVAEPSEMIL